MREAFREKIAQIDNGAASGHASNLPRIQYMFKRTLTRENFRSYPRFRRAGRAICFRTKDTITPWMRNSRAGTRSGKSGFSAFK